MTYRTKMALAIWADSNGDYIIIGDEDCKAGDPVLIIPLDAETILDWIKALLTMKEDGELMNIPGQIGKCTERDRYNV